MGGWVAGWVVGRREDCVVCLDCTLTRHGLVICDIYFIVALKYLKLILLLLTHQCSFCCPSRLQYFKEKNPHVGCPRLLPRPLHTLGTDSASIGLMSLPNTGVGPLPEDPGELTPNPPGLSQAQKESSG